MTLFSRQPEGKPSSGTKRRAALAATFLLTAAVVAGYLWNSSEIPSEPGFYSQSCWFSTGRLGEVSCGTLVVRENRSVAGSRTIALPVVVLKAPRDAQGRGQAREPIIYLNGGPGDRLPLSSQYEMDSWAVWREDFPPGHDLVLVGLRGTGRDDLDFNCPEMHTAEISLAAHPPGGSPPDSRALAVEAVTACARRLEAEGVDLTAYNSRESAADIAELREVLDIDAAVLYGVSYGTRLALSVLRYHPEGILAVILDGVVPPEAAEGLEVADFYRRALQNSFDDCAANRACANQFGDIEARYSRLLQRLKERPIRLNLADYLDSGERAELGLAEDATITFDDTWLGWLLSDAVMDRSVPILVPLLIDDIERQRFVTLKARLRESLLLVLDSQAFNSWAVYLSHVCRDEAAFESPEAIAEAVTAAGDLAYMVEDYAPNYLCAHWPSGAADAVESRAVVSDVPTLLLSGRFDPLTPPVLARRAAVHLSDSHLFTLADKSHGALYESRCARHLVRSFLATLTRPTQTGCQPQDLVVRAGK